MSEMLKEFAERSRALAALANGPMRDRLIKLAEDYEERATGKTKRSPASLALRLSDK